MTMLSYYSVLTIAGSDSGGGAGVQADLKTFSALGCFGTSAITAITVQNTRGVFGIHSIPPAIVHDQIKVVMDDIRPAAIKIGMVHTADLAVAIALAIKDYAVPVILDPVMVATSGDKLIEDNTIDTLKQKLFPLSHLVTPNVHEAQLLAGISIKNKDDMRRAAREIIKTGCRAVLIKGAHLKGDRLFDVYLDKNGTEEIFESDFVDTDNTHGTGCTLSSAIAAYRATGVEMVEAIAKATQYVHQAIEAGRNIRTGDGHGPLNHFFNPQKMITHVVE
jgi:hydroxymethylpyrimidine/phosphomethylpyrimidine kinase